VHCSVGMACTCACVHSEGEKVKEKEQKDFNKYASDVYCKDGMVVLV